MSIPLHTLHTLKQYKLLKGSLRRRIEEKISKDAQYSYWYANEVLKGRFELGEPIIAKSAEYSYHYANGVLKGRFELGEPIIATDARYSYWYANEVLKLNETEARRWRLGRSR